MFGGGGSFGRGFGRNYSNGYGGFGQYSGYGNSYGGKSHGSSSRSESSSGSQGTILGSNHGSGGFGHSLYSNTKQQGSDDIQTGAQLFSHDASELSDELPIAQRLPQLAQKMTAHLEKHCATYNKATDSRKALRALLAQRSFLADIERMTTIAQLCADPEGQEFIKEESPSVDNITHYENTVIKAVPLLVAAAKIASRPLERLYDEQLIPQRKKKNAASIQRDLAAKNRLRNKSYHALINWLSVIRQTDQTKIKQAVVAELQTHASRILGKLEEVLKKNSGPGYMSYEDSESLVMLTQKLFESQLSLATALFRKKVKSTKMLARKSLPTLSNKKRE